MSSSSGKSILTGIVGGACITTAWFIPGTLASALLTCVTAICIAYIFLRWNASYLPIFLIGFPVYTFNFYWLIGTLSDFGGFSLVPSLLLFTAYAVLSSHQLLVCSFIFRNLPERLDRFALRGAIAWVSAEILSLRIFPWLLGHTLISFSYLAQSAKLLGAPLVSFIIIWSAESLIRLIFSKKRAIPHLASLIVLLALCAYGFIQVSRISSDRAPVSVVLIQAEAKIASKNGMRYFEKNSDKFIQLSSSIKNNSDLIIWPETVVVDFVPSDLVHKNLHGILSQLPDNPMLIGALTYRSREEIYNSALAIQANGKIEKPYHKQILMPFGEYIPLADYFPFLNDFYPMPNFKAGEEETVFTYQNPDLKVSALICYEDVIAGPARRATLKGAEVLVNITNDGWFGPTVAPLQHNLIAAFRAIENDRYLLRSTLTGYTTVIDPTGKTVSHLDRDTSGILRYDAVYPNNQLTPFTRYFGYSVWWILSVIAACVAILTKAIKLRNEP